MENSTITLKKIASMKSDYIKKDGMPRQSNLDPDFISYVVFEPEYGSSDALCGIEDNDYLWLLWGFSENMDAGWSSVVFPPGLGGNIKKGVFATRSPFRPNPIGLSSVKLEEIIKTPSGKWILKVSGADLLDGTPIYDIKPYVTNSDSHPDCKTVLTQDELES